MHGIVRPPFEIVDQAPSRVEKVKAKVHEYRFFLLLVILPTLLVAAYYYLIASDQYESEADFVVRSASQSSAGSVAGLGSLLSIGGNSAGHNDTMSVIDFLKSTEATIAMEKSTGLIKRFHRSDIDPLSRLHSATPAPESLRKYYNKQVKVKIDPETGIAKLTVHAFTPLDAYVISNDLLRLGEKRINQLNDRSNADQLLSANRQLAEAENDVAAIQLRMTAYRKNQRDIDPEASGKAQVTMATTMEGTLAAARAQLGAMRGIISPSSPQYIAAEAKTRALQGEIARQGDKTAGNNATSMANSLGGYESLLVRQEFVAKRYDLAAAAYTSAREDARKKELYLIRIVNPNMPVKALFPERRRIVLTVLAALMVAYGVGWLLAAGVKEHAIT